MGDRAMEEILLDALERLLGEHCDRSAVRGYERGESVHALWEQLEGQGYPDALRPEQAGGAALDLGGLCKVVLLLGKYLLPVPLAETMIARALLSEAGAALPDGPIVLLGAIDSPRARALSAVPFANVARYALLEGVEGLELISLADLEVVDTGVRGSYAAHLHWHRPQDVLATLSPCAVPLLCINAALRAALMVGVMAKILAMTLEYAGSREQFGRPIAKFQVIQHQITEMAEQVLSADMAVQLAFSGTGRWPAPLRAAVAKQRSSAAASRVAALGHAVHGAIGLSEEYPLQLYTRRLYEWRLTEGSDLYWARQIGDACLGHPGDALEFVRAHLAASA
jgi:acyl-CoA dehydrogenase